MKVLVTGANGQIDFCLVQALQRIQWDFKAVTRTELDITDVNAVEAFF